VHRQAGSEVSRGPPGPHRRSNVERDPLARGRGQGEGIDVGDVRHAPRDTVGAEPTKFLRRLRRVVVLDLAQGDERGEHVAPRERLDGRPE